MEEVEDIEDVTVVMVEKSQDEKEEKTKEVKNFKLRKLFMQIFYSHALAAFFFRYISYKHYLYEKEKCIYLLSLLFSKATDLNCYSKILAGSISGHYSM